jgi:hypothetical protein
MNDTNDCTLIKNCRRGKIYTRLYPYLIKRDETVQNTVFWRVTTSSLVESYQRFVETYCPFFTRITKETSDQAGQSDKGTFLVAQKYLRLGDLENAQWVQGLSPG